MLYSPFNPPREDDIARTRRLSDFVYSFDNHMAARQRGYFIHGADFRVPATDPHGNPWSLLLDSELEARKSWCMMPAQHRALDAQLAARAGLVS